VTTGGSAYCWGHNTYGELGDGTYTDRLTPTPVSGGLSFATVTAGRYHTCGVTTGWSAYCWGSNTDGQLGNGTMTDWNVPVPVSGGLSFAYVHAGDDHTCGQITADKSAYCWGANTYGQIGNFALVSPLATAPVPVTGGLPFPSLSAGSDHTCGSTDAETAYCWGRNSSGQLGDGTTTDRNYPDLVSTALSFITVSAGGHHTCGLEEAEFVAHCWGGNFDGQLGDGTLTDSRYPVLVSGSLKFTMVSAGDRHTCGVTSNGSVYCWGGNDEGQLGDGTTTERHTPVHVVFP
jgi:alpha-tubulin suppressor-like RCC1 family protein